jgi:hypothetical protein
MALFVCSKECDAQTGLGTRLEGLLIAPIQRIPRYTLLLAEMKKNTPEHNMDMTFHLEKAIPAMQEVADYLNSNIKQSENQQKLMELSLKGAQVLKLLTQI